MAKIVGTVSAWSDSIALYIVQPLIAGMALYGLASTRFELHGTSATIYMWGSIFLLQIIFADDIWSFATRHEEKHRLGMLWAKLIGAGICAVLTFASIYRQVGLIDQGQLTHSAGTALYFSITAWSTVGFGDVVPTIDARAFAAVQSLVGLVYDSAVIGLVLYASTRARL